MKRVIALSMAAALLLGGVAAGARAPELSLPQRIWPDESIYFIMLDRFSNGDPSNDAGANPTDPKGWHGGDLQGVIDKLDYIKSLGFTAIWITPHVKNAGMDYHGYGAVDFFDTDPHFGTVAKTKELVEQAHARGIKVIFDIVVNHTGPKNPLVYEHRDWFHPQAEITDWNDPAQLQNGWIFNLPDFDQSKPEVRDYILKYSRFWIDQTGVDGFRLDTVKHVPPEFFTWYTKELQKVKPGFWVIGEVWADFPEQLAEYQKAGVTALLDFPMDKAARSAFGRDGSMSTLASTVEDDGKTLPDPWQAGGFLDNHDMQRFVTYAQQDDPIARLKLGLTFLYTQRSIPILYYGTEIALPGGDDPDNRADFPWGAEQHTDVRSLVQQLNQLRREHVALRRGTVENLLADYSHYAYGRAADGDQVVVVLNNDDKEPFSDEVDLSAMGIADGTILKDTLTGREVTVADGKIRPRVDPHHGAIFVVTPQPRLQGALWGAMGGLGLLVLLGLRRRRAPRR